VTTTVRPQTCSLITHSNSDAVSFFPQHPLRPFGDGAGCSASEQASERAGPNPAGAPASRHPSLCSVKWPHPDWAAQLHVIGRDQHDWIGC
jgi:hypothetical protein